MTFYTLIFKNLLRRPMRSLLTILGIAIGIGAVVALTSIAWGFESGMVNIYKARGTDLVVTKTTSRSAMPVPFPATTQDEVRALPHIREITGVLSDIVSIEDSPAILLFGWEPQSFLWFHLKLVKGQWPGATTNKVVAVGTVAAEMLGKSVGDKIQIETAEYTVCAIFTSSALAENGALILPLAEMQSLTDRNGMVNFLNVQVDPATTAEQVEQLRRTIKARFKGLTAFNPGEAAQSNTAIQMAKAMSLATSLIALVVGTVGIMNTILMSVFERLQEIGVLLALGWRRGRIMRMILCESLALSFAGGIAGCLLGLVAVRLLQASPWIHGKLEGQFNPLVLGLALLIALGLGALGGVYPAWIGSRMSPVTALRHE